MTLTWPRCVCWSGIKVHGFKHTQYFRVNFERLYWWDRREWEVCPKCGKKAEVEEIET